MNGRPTQDDEQLQSVDIWDSHGNPYWNGVAKAGSKPPGVGKLHRARIENGRVVAVECGARAETWVPFTASSTPQEDRQTCSRCGRLTRVPGVERDSFWNRVKLTDEYDPANWSPIPATDGGVVEEKFRHENWLRALKETARQFEAENGDLEATLEGDIGFHAFYTKNGDVSRGSMTAVYQGVYDLMQEVSIDDEIVELHYGEVTPQTVRQAVIDQLEESTYLSKQLKESIGDRVEENVRRNMERDSQ